VLTDWIISSGNTSLSIDLLISCLEQLSRDDIVEVVQKGQGIYLALLFIAAKSHLIHYFVLSQVTEMTLLLDAFWFLIYWSNFFCGFF